MTQEELNRKIEMHKHWLEKDVEGAGSMRANLEGANLMGADLEGANLRGANLRGANLDDADLRGADLEGANLMGANLMRANLKGANLDDADLRGADLEGADLEGANLMGANLKGADLEGANLDDADLRGADLEGANLDDADLRGANLMRANLKGADLEGANLRDAENIFLGFACPDSGSFIAWKKCVTCAGHYCIVKLKIPDDARRSSATTNKCRADKAIVLGIESMYGEPYPDDFQAQSIYYKAFKYKKGELLEVKDFDGNRWNECSTGIHFFINRIDAFNY